MSTGEPELKTVAVLGGSYGGNRAAQVLAAGLPIGWRVVLVDRNSHFNHVYNLPRYTVLPGHEHKAFVPYNNLFDNSSHSTASQAHERVHGTITSLHSHHLTYTPPLDGICSVIPAPSGSLPVEPMEKRLRFDYAIYALGSHLPSPIDLWGSRNTSFSSEGQGLACSDLKSIPQSVERARRFAGMKRESVLRLQSRQQRIKVAQQVLVIGGGALGIQFASDIAAIYPHKSVTLLHSRPRLLPRFDEALGDEVYRGLQELGVRVIFGERLDLSSLNVAGTNAFANQEKFLVRTVKGREIETDLLLLCTGQKPNTSLLHTMDSRIIDPESGMVRVSRTMQIQALRENDTPSDGGDLYPHLFAIGDAADAFGAIKAGHTAYYQGEVAARNVLRLIKGEENVETGLLDSVEDSARNLELEEYVPGPPMIKVSLGLTKSAYEVDGVVGTKYDGVDDLGAAVVWRVYGYKDVDDEGMWM